MTHKNSLVNEAKFKYTCPAAFSVLIPKNLCPFSGEP